MTSPRSRLWLSSWRQRGVPHNIESARFASVLTPLFLLLVLALPWILSDPYQRHLLVMTGIFVLLALGLDFIVGYVGELSLGHAAFFGVGGYATALFALHTPIPFPLDLVLACAVTAVFGFFIGYPSLRLRGPYFAIATFGFAEILRLVALNWMSVTRGPMGLPNIPSPDLFGLYTLSTEVDYYYLVLVLVGLAVFTTRRLLGSTIGQEFLAIRENEELARAVGVGPFRVKLIAFCVGMSFAGAAGSVYARYLNFVDPSTLGFFYTSVPLAMVIIGGRGSIRGTLLGACLLTWLPEFLRVADEYRLPIFGLLIVLAVLFMPKGINGVLAGRSRH